MKLLILSCIATMSPAIGSSLRSAATKSFEIHMTAPQRSRRLQLSIDEISGLSEACQEDTVRASSGIYSSRDPDVNCPNENFCTLDFSRIASDIRSQCNGTVITSDHTLECDIEDFGEATIEFRSLPVCVGYSCTPNDIKIIQDATETVVDAIDDFVTGIDCEVSAAPAKTFTIFIAGIASWLYLVSWLI